MLKRYSLVMHVRGTNAPHTTQKKILENTTLMETETCTRQHILDQHDKSQSHHDLLKLHLVSKNLPEKNRWQFVTCIIISTETKSDAL